MLPPGGYGTTRINGRSSAAASAAIPRPLIAATAQAMASARLYNVWIIGVPCCGVGLRCLRGVGLVPHVDVGKTRAYHVGDLVQAAADVRPHHSGQGLDVAAFQRLHDAHVLGLRVRAAPLLHVDPAYEMDAGIHAFQRAHEFLVTRVTRQHQVEGLVQLQQARGLAVFRHVARTLDEGPQFGQLRIAGAFAGRAHDAGLQHGAVLIQRMDLLGVQQPGDETPVDRRVRKPSTINWLSTSRKGVRLTFRRRASSTSLMRSPGLKSKRTAIALTAL